MYPLLASSFLWATTFDPLVFASQLLGLQEWVVKDDRTQGCQHVRPACYQLSYIPSPGVWFFIWKESRCGQQWFLVCFRCNFNSFPTLNNILWLFKLLLFGFLRQGLVTYPRLALNLWTSCLTIPGLQHHTQLRIFCAKDLRKCQLDWRVTSITL